MNTQQANLLLEKINGLHKSISLDGEVSSIERDLMMSYIRQLYVAYMDVDSATNTQPIKAKTKAKAKVIESPKPIPTPKVVEAKVEPKPIVKEVPKTEVAPPPVASTPKPEPVSIPTATTEVSKGSPAVEALFRHQAAKELSEKLSQANISDLTRALSINDKLLYSNELFGRDMASMNSTLLKLNQLPDMTAAKNLLVGIADNNNWGDSERSEVAESFIKMVRRRY